MSFRLRAVEGRQRGSGVVAAALPLPEPREAHGGPQLPRPALLAPGRLDGLAKAVLGAADLVGRLGKEQLASEAVQFGLLKAVVIPCCEGRWPIAKLSSCFVPEAPRPE
jgi:hypothetical protein